MKGRQIWRLLSELHFFCLLIAFGVLCGWEWLAAALLAAMVHESGHLLMLRGFGAGRGRLRIDGAGLSWERRGRTLGYGGELLSFLAGPAANGVAALLLARIAAASGWQGGYFLAGTQLVLGGFNLLPVLPLDGAQALITFLSWLIEPVTAYRITTTVSLLALGMLLASAVWFLALTGTGFLLMGTLGLLVLCLQEMGLVKRGENE